MKTSARKDNTLEVKQSIFEIIDTMPEIEMRNLLTGLEKWQRSKLDCKRKHPRKDTFISARIKTNGRRYNGYVTNVSTNGLFIEVNIPKAVRNVLFIEFVHPAYDELIKANCEIVRSDLNGIGVKLDQDFYI